MPQVRVNDITMHYEQQGAGEPLLLSRSGRPLLTSDIRRLVVKYSRLAGIDPASPHMLRHACGYALANKGHDTRALQAYLGHRNIQHTVRYTELAPTRFKDFWRA